MCGASTETERVKRGNELIKEFDEVMPSENRRFLWLYPPATFTSESYVNQFCKEECDEVILSENRIFFRACNLKKNEHEQREME